MINIRKIQLKDVDTIVALHCEAFQGFFLTSLGSTFLKCYYSCFIQSQETISICAEENGNILGFAVSTKHSKGFNSRLVKQNIIKFGILAIKLLITKPKALLRLVKNFSKTSELVEDNEDYAELFSIGVSPKTQGLGIGKQLLTETENLMCQEDVKRLSLTTDYFDNESTIKFYESKGYRVLYEFDTYPSRRMYRMIKIVHN